MTPEGKSTLWKYWKPGDKLLRFAYRAYTTARNALFTKSRPGGKYYRVHASEERVRNLLRKSGTAEWYQFSYNYGKECINRRKPVWRGSYTDDYQFHVRGWNVDGQYVEVHGHIELDAIKHPRRHIDGENISWEEGMDRLESILDESELEYIEVEYRKEDE